MQFIRTAGDSKMCHLQEVWDDSNDYTMSLPERGWRSFKIRVRILKLRLLFLKERIRKILILIIRGNNSKVDNDPLITPTPLQSGDRVRVRPFWEIKDTLDQKGFYKGMLFIDDMVQFCGKTYKVFKRVNKVYMHRDKKMQKCRGVVLLEGVLCHGYGAEIDCDRTCFFFWKEDWLEKIE
jgi:hypothetical protein